MPTESRAPRADYCAQLEGLASEKGGELELQLSGHPMETWQWYDGGGGGCGYICHFLLFLSDIDSQLMSASPNGSVVHWDLTKSGKNKNSEINCSKGYPNLIVYYFVYSKSSYVLFLL